MNPMDMLNLQRDVKENAEVMQATSRELQNWEKDMKKKEQQIKIYRQQSEVRNVPTNKGFFFLDFIEHFFSLSNDRTNNHLLRNVMVA